MAPRKVTSVASSFLVVAGIFHGGAAFDIDVAKLKVGAKSLLVDGVDTGMNHHLVGGVKVPYLSSVDSIDRTLGVHVNLPASGNFPGAITDVDTSLTCNRTWQCGALDFKTCPGMSLTTSMVRDFGAVTAGTFASQTLVKPTFAWEATASKYYTLLFVDFFNQDATAFWGSGYHHWSVYNIEGNDVTTGTESGRYGPPNTANPHAPNHYTFLLFQHDSKLSDATIDAAKATATAMPFVFANYLTMLGLKDSDLVSVNWWKATGDAIPLVRWARGGLGPFIPPDACAVLTTGAGNGVLNMCSETVDTTCDDYRQKNCIWQ